MKKGILNPNEIKQRKNSLTNIKCLSQLWKIQIPDKNTPIIVIVNKKSGGQKGEQILSSFYRNLNPFQVIDLLDDGLERLNVFENIQNVKIVIAGGDGTISSVITYIREKINEWSEKNFAPVAILPLGTGNDLSRSMGWGGTINSLDVKDFLQIVCNNKNKILLDSWKISIDSSDKINHVNFPFIMYNYFGIGLDAKYCLGFHQLRKKYPYLFKTRVFLIFFF